MHCVVWQEKRAIPTVYGLLALAGGVAIDLRRCIPLVFLFTGLGLAIAPSESLASSEGTMGGPPIKSCGVLLAEVVANPNDRESRRELALTLIKLGFPERGKLILLALAAEEGGRESPSRKKERKLTEDILLAKHGGEWAPAGLGEGADVEYEGGMVRGLAIDARRFASGGAELVRRAPIRKLELRNATPGLLESIARAGLLKDIVELRLGECEDCHSVIPKLEQYAPKIERLALTDSTLTDGDLTPLLQSSLVKRLKGLDLGGNYLTESGVASLLSGRANVPLESLVLDGNVLGPKTLAGLLQHPALKDLRSLSLRGTWGADGETLASLLKSLPALETLDFSGNRFTDKDFDVLAALPSLGKIRHLKLSNMSGVTAAGWTRLAGARWMSGIRALDLSHNPSLSKGALGNLMNASQRGIVSLDVSHCNLNDDALALVFESDKKSKLQKLNLAHNKITDKSATRLWASGVFSGLIELNLSGNPLGDTGLKTLLATNKVGQSFWPTSVALAGTGISEDGLNALLRSPAFSGARELDLSQLALGAETVSLIEALAQRQQDAPLKIALRGAVLHPETRKGLATLNSKYPNLFIDF